MAQTIKLKRSAQSGASGIPSTSDLALGEVGINTYHGKMYIKKDDGTESIVEVGSTGSFLPLSGGTLTGNLSLGDNVKAQFGASDDLQIYHDGSASYIADVGTGDLILQAGNDLILRQPDGSTEYLRANEGAGVQIYHNGSQKFLTTSTGIDVTGSVVADGLTVDGVSNLNGGIDISSANTFIYFMESDTANANTLLQGNQGAFSIKTVNDAKSVFTERFKISHSTGDISFYEDTGTTPKLTWDASAELLTTTGLDVTGEITADSLTVDGNVTFNTDTLKISDNIPKLVFEDTDTSTLASITANSSHITYDTVATSRDHIFKQGGTTRMVIDDTGIDVTGKATMDGLTVSASQAGGVTAQIQNSNPTQTGGSRLDFLYSGSTVTGRIQNRFNGSDFQTDWYTGNHGLEIFTDLAKTEKRLDIAHNGDISFYEDTGTTAKLFWDASAESLGIGTSSPSSVLHLSTSNDPKITLTDTGFGSSADITGSNGNLRLNSQTATIFDMADSEVARIDSSGNVGIGATSANSSRLRLDNGGTSGAPQLMLTATGASTQTEIRHDTSNNLIFENWNSGRTERMRIDSSGRVGIGTSSPSSFSGNANNLVVGSGSGTEGITINSGSANYGTIYFADGTSGSAAYAGNINYNHADNSMRLGTNGSTTDVVIDSSGRVGIGTDSPSEKLTVDAQSADGVTTTIASFHSNEGESGDTAIQLAVRRSDSLGSDRKTFLNATGAGNFEIQRSGTTTATIDSSGRLGIGCSPDTLLHVNGQAKFENNIILNENTPALIAPSGDLRIFTGGSETMRIDASKRVGIGCSPTVGKLQVDDASGATLAVTRTSGSTSGTLGTIRFGNTDIDSNLVNIVAFQDGATNSGAIKFETQSTGGATAERMRIDSAGRVGIGVVPETWNSGWDALQIGASGALFSISSGNENVSLTSNTYLATDGNYKYIATNEASQYLQSAGAHYFRNATSGTADTNITFSPAMTLEASGNLLVGQTSISQYTNTAGTSLRASGFSTHTRDGGDVLLLNRLTSDGSILQFRKDNTTVGSIGSALGDSSVSTLFIADAGNVGIRFDQASTDDIQPCTSAGADRDNAINLGAADNRFKDLYLSGGVNVGDEKTVGHGAISLKYDLVYMTAGVISPSNSDGTDNDNAIDLGKSAARFDDIYATNGTIQTSDRNEKQDIEELSDAEQRVAIAAKGLLKKFRWKDAVAEKGDDARIHFGIIAQDLQDAFEAEGLDAGRYGMFTSNTWTNEDGEEQTRMGVRYSELLAFIISAI